MLLCQDVSGCMLSQGLEQVIVCTDLSMVTRKAICTMVQETHFEKEIHVIIISKVVYMKQGWHKMYLMYIK